MGFGIFMKIKNGNEAVSRRLKKNAILVEKLIWKWGQSVSKTKIKAEWGSSVTKIKIKDDCPGL